MEAIREFDAISAANRVVEMQERGCNIRISLPNSPINLHPISVKIREAEKPHDVNRKIISGGGKVEPWFICENNICVSFKSCYRHIQIEDVYGNWYKLFISGYYRNKFHDYFCLILPKEELNLILLEIEVNRVLPGMIYMQGYDMFLVTSVKYDKDTSTVTIYKTNGHKDTLISKSYPMNITYLDNLDNYFVPIKYNETLNP